MTTTDERMSKWAPDEWARAKAKYKRIDRLVFVLTIIASLIIGLSGCSQAQVKGDDLHLRGKAGELFRQITGAQAMTVSERVTIYGSENPPSELLQCHENEHKKQAKIVGDVNVNMSFIDDDELSRTMQWISTYSNDWIQRGYANNRWELGAREACKHLEAQP